MIFYPLEHRLINYIPRRAKWIVFVNRAEPFVVQFCALALYTCQHIYSALRPGITPLLYTKHVLMYMVIVGSILNEDAPPPPFSYLGMSLIYDCSSSPEWVTSFCQHKTWFIMILNVYRIEYIHKYKRKYIGAQLGKALASRIKG